MAVELLLAMLLPLWDRWVATLLLVALAVALAVPVVVCGTVTVGVVCGTVTIEMVCSWTGNWALELLLDILCKREKERKKIYNLTLKSTV